MTADTLIQEREAPIERCILTRSFRGFRGREGGTVITPFFLPAGRISHHDALQE